MMTQQFKASNSNCINHLYVDLYKIYEDINKILHLVTSQKTHLPSRLPWMHSQGIFSNQIMVSEYVIYSTLVTRITSTTPSWKYQSEFPWQI